MMGMWDHWGIQKCFRGGDWEVVNGDRTEKASECFCRRRTQTDLHDKSCTLRCICFISLFICLLWIRRKTIVLVLMALYYEKVSLNLKKSGSKQKQQWEFHNANFTFQFLKSLKNSFLFWCLNMSFSEVKAIVDGRLFFFCFLFLMC